MTRRMLARRLRSRLQGERGFTIVETVVAITVIFGSLTALAYTATIGFRYIAFGRDRIQATGYANKVMEGVRALPYAAITKGLDTAEYSTDPNIELCGADYRLFNCAGEKLVGQTFSGGYTEDWIVPHTGTTTTDNNLELTWSTYVTNDDVAANPYSVTVQVSWEGGGAIASGAENLVRVQSAFWSPSGCVSSTTHPFAAPCQPFFYGQALVPPSTITIESGGAFGAFHESVVDFEEGTIALPGAEASLQQEQVADLDARSTTSYVDVFDLSGRDKDGFAETVWAADSDPSSDTTASGGGAAAVSAGGYLERLQPDPAGEIGAKMTSPAGDTATAGLSTEATLADLYACPPSGTAETDGLACSAVETQFAGMMTVVAPLSHVAGALGPATIVKVGPAPSASKTTVERDVSSTTDEDGLVESQATRSLGTIYIGGFPTAGMTPPLGMSASDSVFNNYCLRIQGYQDTVRAIAGESTATAPSATINAGTLSYFSAGAGAYVNVSVTNAATLSALTFTCTDSEVVGGSNVEWEVSVVAAGDIVPGSTSTSSTNDPSDAEIRWETEARATPIALTVHYRLTVDAVDEVDLTMTVDLGEVVAQSSYEPPPEFGI